MRKTMLLRAGSGQLFQYKGLCKEALQVIAGVLVLAVPGKGTRWGQLKSLLGSHHGRAGERESCRSQTWKQLRTPWSCGCSGDCSKIDEPQPPLGAPCCRSRAHSHGPLSILKPKKRGGVLHCCWVGGTLSLSMLKLKKHGGALRCCPVGSTLSIMQMATRVNWRGRERKQQEMDNLVAHVQALEADNEKLRQALRQRNAHIGTLRTPAAPRRDLAMAAALALPRSALPAAPPVFVESVPLHRGFHASPAPRQQPWQAPVGPQMLSEQLGMLAGQNPHWEPPCNSVRATQWDIVGISRLRGGQQPVAAPGPAAGGRADAPNPGQPLPGSCYSLPSSLSRADFNLGGSSSLAASGLLAVPPSSSERHSFSKPLCILPPSSRAHLVNDLDNPSPFGGLEPTRAMLHVRTNSCSDLPPAGPPLESVGGTGPPRHLLRSRSGSYHHMPRRVPAHADPMRHHLPQTLHSICHLPIQRPWNN